MQVDGLYRLAGDLDVVLAGIDTSVKERVHERRLAESRLPDNHQGELEALLDRLAVNLVWERVEPDIAIQRLFDRCRLALNKIALSITRTSVGYWRETKRYQSFDVEVV